MYLESIKIKLKSNSIYLKEEKIIGRQTIIGYEKKFKWKWAATQLNTFIVVTDFGDEIITPEIIANHIQASFDFANKNYKGWPRGLQSALGIISVLISSNISEDSKRYCLKLKSKKRMAGFSIPVTIDTINNEIYSFKRKPMWGKIYYPHFKKLISALK